MTRGYLIVRHRRRTPARAIAGLAMMLAAYAIAGAAPVPSGAAPQPGGTQLVDALGLGGPVSIPALPPATSGTAGSAGGTDPARLTGGADPASLAGGAGLAGVAGGADLAGVAGGADLAGVAGGVLPHLSGAPTEVRIPAIKVRSSLEKLGMDKAGALVPPHDYALAGWFTHGVAPGDPGPAVIAGHVDSRRGPAVFYQLHRLRPGDLVQVRRDGRWLAFAVVATARYAKKEFPAGEVYRPTPGPELRLITCGGTFDKASRSYRDNIVVYAVAVPDR